MIVISKELKNNIKSHTKRNTENDQEIKAKIEENGSHYADLWPMKI
jgi:hypothetical protein